jgi:hypothetical protein
VTALTINFERRRGERIVTLNGRRRQEPAVDRRSPVMSRRDCIGGADQVRRPAVNPNERARSVENPTFDALCGLVRRPAVNHCCYSIYVIKWNYAEYSGAQL